MTTTWTRRCCALVCACALAACSGDVGPAASGVSSASTSVPDTAQPAPSTTPEPAATGVAPGTEPAAGTTPTTSGVALAPEPSGVPGLDSDDAFCSAWSRFGGSWQVLVQASFAGDPTGVAQLEVLASTVIGDAFDDVFAAWPTALDGERDEVADGYFGALQRRSADALAALRAEGAGDADVAALAGVWEAALAGYDPATGQLTVDVPAELDTVVVAAGAAFEAARVTLIADPSMAITVETPDTDAYLATACPDQGWIVGQDVTEG